MSIQEDFNAVNSKLLEMERTVMKLEAENNQLRVEAARRETCWDDDEETYRQKIEDLECELMHARAVNPAPKGELWLYSSEHNTDRVCKFKADTPEAIALNYVTNNLAWFKHAEIVTLLRVEKQLKRNVEWSPK